MHIEDQALDLAQLAGATTGAVVAVQPAPQPLVEPVAPEAPLPEQIPAAEAESVESVEEDDQVVTKRPIWENPLPKLVVLAGGMGMVAIILIGMLSNATNAVKNMGAVKEEPEPSPEVNLAETPTETADSEDPENLKANLALTTQKHELARLNEEAKKQQTAAAAPKPQKVAPEPVAVAPRPVQPRYSPPARSSYTPVQSYTPSRSYTSAVPFSAPSRPTPVPISAPAPQAPAKPAYDDPQKAAQVAQIGDYGSGVPVEDRVATAPQPRNLPRQSSSAAVAALPPAAMPVSSWDNLEPSLTNAVDPNSGSEFGMVDLYGEQQDFLASQLVSEQQAFLSGSPLKQIDAGTTANGKIQTMAVLGVSDQFLVEISNPVKASDGSVAIPSGSQLVVQIDNALANGMVVANATEVISKDASGQIVRTPLPAGVLQISNGDKPLMAKVINGKRGRVASSMGMNFMLGALGNAAGLFTRTQQNVVSNSNGYLVTNQNPETNLTNLAAGVLEGGVDAVLPEMQARQQQQLEQVANEPEVHALEAGKKVTIQVVSPFDFAGV